MKQLKCEHIFVKDSPKCLKCMAIFKKGDNGLSCLHEISYIDGFATCINCGHCFTNMIDFKFDQKRGEEESFINIIHFQDILINNHIFHNFEIATLYLEFKKKSGFLKLQNSHIFAYATYIFLRKKDEFRSLKYISDIFHINFKKFIKSSSKILSFLKINENENTYINENYFFSLVFPFLDKHKLKKLIKKTLDLILKIKNKFYQIRGDIIAGGCVLYILENERIKIKHIEGEMSHFFPSSFRTISNFKNRLKKDTL
jgi:hypothetical protein